GELSSSKGKHDDNTQKNKNPATGEKAKAALDSVVTTFLETGATMANELIRKEALSSSKRDHEGDHHEAKVVEVDDVFVGNSSESVGTCIKNEALKLYPSYNNLDHSKKAVVELGLNSILDIFIGHATKTNSIHPPQSYLFSDAEWKELSLKFNHMSSEYDVVAKYKDKIKKIEECAKGDLKDARQHTYMAEMKSTRDDESILYAIYTHYLEVLEYHQYIFQDDIDITELDFGVKLWGPMLEKLFRNTSLRCKWGESVGDSSGVAESRGFKVDVRIVRDTLSRRRKEADQANVEMARKNPTISKTSSDRIKLLIESKCVLDRLAKEVKHFKHHEIVIPALQLAGPRASFYSLQLGSNGLYIGMKDVSGTVPNKKKDLYLFRRVVDLLFRFKVKRDIYIYIYICVCVWVGGWQAALNVSEYTLTTADDDDDDDYDDDDKNSDSNKESIDYLLWLRGTWIPPRSNIKKKLPSIPSILTASDL
ncbi:hypothetical protein INT45_002929, partial [Circinella minor]